MLRLKPRQQAALGDTFRALANLVVAALVLTQVAGRQALSWGLISAGVAAWTVLVAIAPWLIGEE